MKPDSQYPGISRIVYSLVWAFAIIVTAFLFKGSPALYWLEAAFVVGALAFVVLKPLRPASTR
jgi:hypothetical protein